MLDSDSINYSQQCIEAVRSIRTSSLGLLRGQSGSGSIAKISSRNKFEWKHEKVVIEYSRFYLLWLD